MRFEWQHHGSPHVHGLAWLSGAPDVKQIVASADGADTAKEELTKYVDRTATTLNLAILPDGSNVDDTPTPNQPYAGIENVNQDLADFAANNTHAARLCTAYALAMDSKSAVLAIQSYCSQRQHL